jgi:hypothetical protein
VKARLLFFLAAGLAAGLPATQTDYQAGLLAAPWLAVPTDARTTAMAAQAAVPKGLGSLSANPAGLGALKGYELEAGHTAWLLGSAIEHAGLGWGTGKTGLALGFDYVGFGSVDAYSLSGGSLQANGSLNPTAYALTLGLGQQLAKGLDLGVAGKWISQSIDGSSAEAGYAVDLGLSWEILASGLHIGVAAQNLGDILQDGRLPGQLRAGLAYVAKFGKDQWTVAADDVAGLAATDGSASAINVGTEYSLRNLVDLRVGYSIAQRGLGGAAGLSAGLGVCYAGWRLGYAFNGQGELGAGQQVTLGVGW